MSRCIVVIGPHRSGTSCVAGVLHKLGAVCHHGPMRSRGNPVGHFEDVAFVSVGNEIIGMDWRFPKKRDPEEEHWEKIRECVRARESEYDLWTMKDPRLCFTAKFIVPELSKARVVLTERSTDASARSLHMRDGFPLGMCINITKRYLDARDEFLGSWDGPTINMPYDFMLDAPKMAVEKLSKFVFEDFGRPRPSALRKAVAHVDPTLRHHV